MVFWNHFPSGCECFREILHAHCTFIPILICQILSSHLYLRQSYAILNMTVQ